MNTQDLTQRNLDDLHRKYGLARKALKIANTLGGHHRSRAMSIMNKHRNKLRWAQRGGRRETYIPTFETTVSGIPCGVVVTEYHYEEDDNICFDYFLVDGRGYRAKWLERKTQPSDEQRLFDEYLAFREEDKNDY